MRNIPVFTTEFGVASLTLSQIPYTSEAYIRIQDTQTLDVFLSECCDFCKAAGAESVFATGHEGLESYPLHTAIWTMTCATSSLPDTDACLFPVQEKTAEKWRNLYNERMRGIPNAVYMSLLDAKGLVAGGNAYFIHRGDALLGIGIAAGNKIDAIVSLERGMGLDVLCALCHALTEEDVLLEVASSNDRALRLYQRLGFVRTSELCRWYKIL